MQSSSVKFSTDSEKLALFPLMPGIFGEIFEQSYLKSVFKSRSQTLKGKVAASNRILGLTIAVLGLVILSSTLFYSRYTDLYIDPALTDTIVLEADINASGADAGILMADSDIAEADAAILIADSDASIVTADATITGDEADSLEADAVTLEYDQEQSEETELKEISNPIDSTAFEQDNEQPLPPFHHIILQAAMRYDIDPALIRAVIMAESSNNPNAVSRSGAMGLMQLMPRTARALGVEDILDPEHNINGGVKYLRQLIDRFDGDITLALAAYNAGTRNVLNYNGVPPFRETRNYIKKVLTYYESYINEITDNEKIA